ncbi:tRNA dihydrouridine synthase A [Nitzschia inconspicua]|uniref:tRNA dihydrouridine synthase A n=1 Tax=Nitzschia inconspicua TaxID=303405 RepID=A0A9K3Q2C6_9STRA|nr:tRNA dihydrouridine synthase A [Nitzschia inconspicua]
MRRLRVSAYRSRILVALGCTVVHLLLQCTDVIIVIAAKFRGADAFLFLPAAPPTIRKNPIDSRMLSSVVVLYQSTSSNSRSSNNNKSDPFPEELFSVAPMMGHTTRHYRYFWRLLSRHATLYTEMIPSSTIVQAYQQDAKRLLASEGKGNNNNSHDTMLHHPDCIKQVLEMIREERQRHPTSSMSSLEKLLRDETTDGNIILQLGGRDPQSLAIAAAIGTAFGQQQQHQQQQQQQHNIPAYSGINLNCGCPSTSVAAGRRTGAALMLEPQHVVQCLNAMTEAMSQIHRSSITTLSVKHRLGVQDANDYQKRKQQLQDAGRYSLSQEEEEAYDSCKAFVSQLVTSSHSSHNLSRIQVHARLALLGLDRSMKNDKESQQKLSSPLWVATSKDSPPVEEAVKVNHQRVQYRAMQQARQATIDNRKIPPLHTNVVAAIARDFSSSRLQVVTNGGIQSMGDVQQRLEPDHVHGAMVGRGAINHPCSFAAVDAVLYEHCDKNSDRCGTRGQVLERYIQYCTSQEDEYFQRCPHESATKEKNSDICIFRKELVAPAYHLFVGEEGNAAFQRLLKRLTSRAQRHTSAQILQASMAQLPDESLNKRIDDHLPWNKIQCEFQESYGEAAMGATKRSGAMQRIVY